MDPDIKFKVTETYKVARTNLAFSVLKQGCKKIVVTSSLAGEGKSTSAVNVAISLATTSRRKSTARRLRFARIRYVGNGDFGRTDRQRLVMDQVFSKVKTQNISQLNDLLNTLLPEVTTNLSKGELFSLVLSMPSYAKYPVDSWHVPVDGAFSYLSVHKMSVLGIDFPKTIAEMQKRIYG